MEIYKKNCILKIFKIKKLKIDTKCKNLLNLNNLINIKHFKPKMTKKIDK